MTKHTLLTTASAAVLALALASPAMAGPNDFANQGNSGVGVLNLSFGGAGGDGGDGGDPGVGGVGGNGGASGAIQNNIDSNSGNTYARTTVNVTAGNEQDVTLEGNYIDTSGYYNEQDGGSASASASAGAAALNVNLTSISGGNATGASVDAETSAEATAGGGEVGDVIANGAGPNGVGDALGTASAYATGNSGDQTAAAEGGNVNGGNGGVGAANDQGFGPGSSNDNETMGGEALAEANGGDTSGDQVADGGPVGSGNGNISGLGSAAGAYAITAASGQFGAVNAGNAIAVKVNTVNSF